MARTKFRGACDRFRKTQQGEDTWQEMMATCKEICESEFIGECDIRDILDEDETWEEYMYNAEGQGDPIRFYKSEETGLYFFQTAGFEFIWEIQN